MPTRTVAKDAVLDSTLEQGLARMAAMIKDALAPYNLLHSVHLPPEQINPTTGGGPYGLHLLADADIVLEEEDSCSVTLHCPTVSYYFLGPVGEAKAASYKRGLAWLIPVIRAHHLNWSLGGLAWKCEPQRARFIGLKDWGGIEWTALRVMGELAIVLDVEKEW